MLAGWVCAGLGFFHPELVAWFDRALAVYQQGGGSLHLLGAIVAMGGAHLSPLLACWLLVRLRSHPRWSARWSGPLLVLGAVPALWVVLAVFSSQSGLRLNSSLGWKVAVAAVLLWPWLRLGREVTASAPPPIRLRVVHGAAAAVLGIFLALHIGNHVVALAGPEVHGDVMQQLRPWYRGAWVEPVWLALFGLVLGSGLLLAVHHLRCARDAYRSLQLASGVYLAVFLLAHLAAVLGRRAAGGETDWNFAVGSLRKGGGLLIPYYGFAVVALWVHASCGLRGVLRSHGVEAPAATRVVWIGSILGVVTAAAIMVAALGWRPW